MAARPYGARSRGGRSHVAEKNREIGASRATQVKLLRKVGATHTTTSLRGGIKAGAPRSLHADELLLFASGNRA